MAKTIIALMYDFDKTLCEKDMQEYGFIPSIGMEPEDFWDEANKIAHKYNMDKILAYMLLMNKQAKKNDLQITKESLQSLEKTSSSFRVLTLGSNDQCIWPIFGFGNRALYHFFGFERNNRRNFHCPRIQTIYACEFHYNERATPFGQDRSSTLPPKPNSFSHQ